jgi:hypothetical protein
MDNECPAYRVCGGDKQQARKLANRYFVTTDINILQLQPDFSVDFAM